MNNYSTVMLRSISIACGVLVFMSSCKDKKTISLAEQTINVGSCEEIVMIRYDDTRFIKDHSIVKLEANDESVFTKITQLQLFEDKIYILDQRSDRFLVFNIDGSFSHNIGVKGRGPQEYIAVNSFYINPERREVTVFDPLTLKGFTFDLEGEFIGIKSVPKEVLPQFFSNMRFIGDGLIACYTAPNDRVESVLFILNEEDMTVVDTLSLRPIKLDNAIYRMATQPFSLVDGKLHFVQWFDNNIYEYDHGSVKPLVEVDTGKPLVPADVLAAAANNNGGDCFWTVKQLVDEGKYSLGLRNLYETSRFIFCEFIYESQPDDLLAWDKKLNRGVLATSPTSVIPGIMHIVYSDNNRLVGYVDNHAIDSFQRKLKKGSIDRSTEDPEIIKALETYDLTEDNPLLFILEINE